MVDRSAMPSAATHHRSSFAPTHPHDPAGPFDLADDLARIGVGVESLPRTLTEASPPIRPVEHEWFSPDERHRGPGAEAEVDVR